MGASIARKILLLRPGWKFGPFLINPVKSYPWSTILILFSCDALIILFSLAEFTSPFPLLAVYKLAVGEASDLDFFAPKLDRLASNCDLIVAKNLTRIRRESIVAVLILDRFLM